MHKGYINYKISNYSFFFTGRIQKTQFFFLKEDRNINENCNPNICLIFTTYLIPQAYKNISSS